MKNVNRDPELSCLAPRDPKGPRGLLEHRHHQPNQREQSCPQRECRNSASLRIQQMRAQRT